MAFDIDQIFKETNGGLDIIRWYVSNIDDFVGTNKHFRMREEKSESCSIKLANDGRYLVTDFGGDGKTRNAIEVVRHEERCTFGEALRTIVTRGNLSMCQNVESMYTLKIRKKDAEANEPDGRWDFEHLEKWPDSWIDIIFSRYTIAEVERTHEHIKPEERERAVYDNLALLLTNQHWHPLKSYTIIKDRQSMRVESQEHYPIIAIEEESVVDGVKKKWKKIYQPKNKVKKYRFMYHNGGDKKFLHGLEQAKAALEKFRDVKQREKKDDKTFEREKVKFPVIFFSTGGSDAMNKMAIGYQCVYGASEYFQLDINNLKDLRKLAYDVYTCPDLDYTGQRQNLALCLNRTDEHFLDIRTVDLPQELKANEDQYQRKCKDVRDYLNYFSAYSFRNLVKMAKPLRFWDSHQSVDREGAARIKFGKPVYEYKISVERMLNFLIKNGFGRFETMPDVVEYVHVDKSVVRTVKPEHIKAFVVSFLRSRFMEEGLIDTVHKSPILSESHFTQLPDLKIDFRDSWSNCQLMFFPNKVIRIDQNEITEIKGSASENFVWDTKIVQKPFKRLIKEPIFEITKEENKFRLKINNKDCLFHRFLIQTSRVHWRTELEDNLDDLPDAEREDYLQKNKFNIAGPNLTESEQYEQELHLMSKYYAAGYLILRYKNPARSWSVAAMDDTPNTDGMPQGGTGKSLFFEAIRQVRQMVTLDGKNEKMFDDSHALEQVNRNTDILYIDDTSKNFNFERLFSLITGEMTVNPKGKTRVSLDKSESPKITFSTNYTPGQLSGSTLRRILFLGFTNYYHDNKLGKFREERTPVDDLGKALFTEFNDEDWNNFLNLMIQCCHLYLSSSKIEAPMKNIMERNLYAEIGINFIAWAENYFDEVSGHIDTVMITSVAMTDFMRFSNLTKFSPQGFNTKLGLYAKYRDWKHNPEELLGKSKRFTKQLDVFEYDKKQMAWIKLKSKTSQSYFYFQTRDDEGNFNEIDGNNVFDPTIDPADLPNPEPDNKKKLPF